VLQVAWAMEGLAKIYAGKGKIDQALANYEAAATIRRTLQAKVPERELFQDELRAIEKAVGDLRQARGQLRQSVALPGCVGGAAAVPASDARTGKAIGALEA
jgi:hypothetical protein